MAIITINPVTTKTTKGFAATVTGIDPTNCDCLIGEIVTPGKGLIEVRWSLGGICRDTHESCNLDMRENENSNLRDTALRLGAK